MSGNSEIDQILALASQAIAGSSSTSRNSASPSSITSPSSASFQWSSCADNPNNCQPHELAPALPLDQYRLHEDPNPEIIRKKPIERVNYTQNVAVRYLKPPQPPPAGDIIIQQLPDRQVAPAPPLHVRQPQPSRPNPEPLVYLRLTSLLLVQAISSPSPPPLDHSRGSAAATAASSRAVPSDTRQDHPAASAQSHHRAFATMPAQAAADHHRPLAAVRTAAAARDLPAGQATVSHTRPEERDDHLV